MDHSIIWHPDIILINAYGEPDEVKTWYTGSSSKKDDRIPTLFVRTRVRGQFKETLELKDFPVDVQVQNHLTQLILFSVAISYI